MSKYAIEIKDYYRCGRVIRVSDGGSVATDDPMAEDADRKAMEKACEPAAKAAP